jgi:hypothetical protein
MFRFLPSSAKWSMVALLSQGHFVSTRGATISLCTSQTRYMTASSNCVQCKNNTQNSIELLIPSRVLEFRERLISLPNEERCFECICTAGLYVSTAAVMIQIIWNITPCRLANSYRHFEWFEGLKCSVSQPKGMSSRPINSAGIWSKYFGL